MEKKMISANNSRSVDVAFHQTALFLGPYLPINSNRIITQQENKLLKIIKLGVIIWDLDRQFPLQNVHRLNSARTYKAISTRTYKNCGLEKNDIQISNEPHLVVFLNSPLGKTCTEPQPYFYWISGIPK